MLIRFSLRDPGEVDLTGFELGDITVQASGATVSSTGREPCKSNMVFISLVILLDGVRNFTQGDRKEFTFIAADSSFRIVFTRLKKGLIKVRVHGELELTVTPDELIRSLWVSASEFYRATDPQLREDAIARKDLESALEDFSLLVNEKK